MRKKQKLLVEELGLFPKISVVDYDIQVKYVTLETLYDPEIFYCLTLMRYKDLLASLLYLWYIGRSFKSFTIFV
ncbi:hypothetical protein [Bartonella sp. CB169]|uniref:hypothetical protein n=1 Tax=Bartonella sp. CB169 TaxID=3112257 RepID=UPI00300DE9C4